MSRSTAPSRFRRRRLIVPSRNWSGRDDGGNIGTGAKVRSMKISKLEAAKRQLDCSIRLFLNDSGGILQSPGDFNRDHDPRLIPPLDIFTIGLYSCFLLHEGRSCGTLRETGEGAVPAGGGRDPAPGRLRDPTGRHYDRSARCSLDWDRPKPGNARRGRVAGSADLELRRELALLPSAASGAPEGAAVRQRIAP